MKTERERHEDFERFVGGVRQAEHMQYLWNNSYPVGTRYDELFRGISRTRVYRSKTEIFVAKAMAEGFTQEQIDMFLVL